MRGCASLPMAIANGLVNMNFTSWGKHFFVFINNQAQANACVSSRLNTKSCLSIRLKAESCFARIKIAGMFFVVLSFSFRVKHSAYW